MINRRTTKAMGAEGTAAAMRQPPRHRHSPQAGAATPSMPSTSIASMKPLNKNISSALTGLFIDFSYAACSAAALRAKSLVTQAG
jgi:hypothetical protein